jgi:cell division protein FtsW
MRRHRPDLLILILMLALMALGLIVVYAIGPTWARFQNSVFQQDLSDWHFFLKHVVSIAMAVACFVAAYLIPVRLVKRWAKLILIVGLVICALMAVAAATGGWGLVNTINGSAGWISLGAFSFQPAEVLKFGLILWMAIYLAEQRRKGSLNRWRTLAPIAIWAGLALVMVAGFQSDLGTAMIIVLITAVMLIASGMTWRILGPIFGGALVLGALLIPLVVTHLPVEKQNRFPTWMGAEQQSEHIQNALIALGTGGVTGVGIGDSVQTAGYLPESLNDSIFAVIGEVFGLVGTVAVVMVLTALLIRVTRVGDRLVDGDNRLITVGVFAWVGGHMLINVMGITGLFVFTGITLPFLSTGGSSMMMMGAALGLVLQLSCYTNREVVNDEDISSWRGHRRTRDASHRRS